MKVTPAQVKDGIAKYIDRELINNIAGLRKWAVGIGGAMIVQSFDSMVSKYKDSLLKMGIMEEDGMIDIEAIYDTAIKVANDKGPVTEHLPIIGDVTFSASDIEHLLRYITE